MKLAGPISTAVLPPVALLLIALAGCSYPHLIDDGKVNETYLARIQRNVARVTSLAIGEPVPYAVITEADARAKFARDLDRDLPEPEALEQARTLLAFGFVEKPIDIRKTMVDLLAEQAAAFYDPVEKKYFFIDRKQEGGFSVWLACWATNRDIPNELTASHELVHALEDRAYGLEKWWRAAGPDDDAQLARQAVIEGDAMHYGFLAMNLSDIELSREDVLEAASGATIERTPRVLKELLVFPYWAGYRFAHGARAAGADPWRTPPGSTAEILDREDPSLARRPRLELGPVAPAKPWSLVRENTLGSFLAGVLLGRAKTPGWLADRYRLYEDAEGRLALAWALVFESDEQAAAFAERYRRFQRTKGIRESAVLHAGRSVAVAEAPDAATFRALMGSAWLACPR